MSAVAAPLMQYHGSKWRIAPWIINLFPSHQIYVEPFGGSAAVLLRKPRSRVEVYNDLDGDVVNLFRVMRDPVQAARLIHDVYLTPYARDEFELSYSSRSDDPVERARLLLFRARAGHGGAGATRRCRVGFRKGSLASGTSYEAQWANTPDNLTAIVERLRGVVIENRPAVAVMQAYDGPDTLHYVDPPYMADTRRLGVGDAYRHDTVDHEALADALHGLTGAVVLSGYRNESYDRLYATWTRYDKSARDATSAERVESVWVKGLVQGRLL